MGDHDRAPEWRDHARCTDSPPTLWDPTNTRGRLDYTEATHTAWRYCSPCPVRTECRQAAIDLRAHQVLQAGVWWVVRGPHQVAVELLDQTGEVAA